METGVGDCGAIGGINSFFLEFGRKNASSTRPVIVSEFCSESALASYKIDCKSIPWFQYGLHYRLRAYLAYDD